MDCYEKYGFNKMTKKLFFTDAAKNFALGLIIGGVFYIVIVWVIESFKENFFIYAWIVTIILTVIVLIT